MYTFIHPSTCVSIFMHLYSFIRIVNIHNFYKMCTMYTTISILLIQSLALHLNLPYSFAPMIARYLFLLCLSLCFSIFAFIKYVACFAFQFAVVVFYFFICINTIFSFFCCIFTLQGFESLTSCLCCRTVCCTPYI